MRFLILAALMLGIAAAWVTQTASGKALLRDARSTVAFWRDLYRLDGRLADGNAMVAMPDGVRLATDVYLPDRVRGRLPAILVRLPYGKRRYAEARHWVDLFVGAGYAVVVQDMRGRWKSEGTFAPYPHAVSDGAATLDWIAAQDWSDGAVGTMGCSALGESQIMLATGKHPAHRAMIAIGAGGAIGTARGDGGFFGFFEGGIPVLAASVGWFSRFGGKDGAHMAGFTGNPGAHLDTLPIRDAVARLRPDPTDYEDFLDRLGTPGAFDGLGYVTDAATFATPALLVDTWYDPGVQSTLALAGLMAETAPTVSTVITAGTHCNGDWPFRSGKFGAIAVDPSQWLDLDALYLAFMNHHLRGGPDPALARFETFRLREDRWTKSGTWPPETARRVTLNLNESALTTRQGGGPRSFVSDPTRPLPSLGGSVCCTGDPNESPGPADLSALDGRADVLLYDTGPLAAPLRLAGPITARLRLVTDVPDTDVVLRLAEVDANGRPVLIQEGGLRLRYRNGIEAPQPVPPGLPVEATVRLRDIAWTVPAGHGLRLYVGGSSFPRLARNMNGGGDPHRETEPHPARITVLPGSELELHTLPAR